MTDKILEKIITQADLLLLDGQDDNQHIEVENGEIVFVERIMGFLHTKIIQMLFFQIHLFLQHNPIGDVFVDGARYILVGTKSEIQRAYKPDLSFIRIGRIPKDFDWNGDFFGAPNLAVEVISHGQTTKQMISKLDRYFEAGTEEAWLIYPDKQVVYQYTIDGDMPLVYGISDTLTSDLFPNLKIVLHDIFTPAH
ncbi:MAG: Uma2 family endonuclease [bacterium]|nr:Uma2 family endonuclease [bacterium]